MKGRRTRSKERRKGSGGSKECSGRGGKEKTKGSEERRKGI